MKSRLSIPIDLYEQLIGLEREHSLRFFVRIYMYFLYQAFIQDSDNKPYNHIYLTNHIIAEEVMMGVCNVGRAKTILRKNNIIDFKPGGRGKRTVTILPALPPI